MANDSFNNGYIPPASGVAPDLTAFFTAAWLSIRGDTVVSYADIAARDSAFLTLSTAQKKGFVCHVETGAARGLYWSDGSTWYRVPAPGLTYSRGTAQGNCDGNGIMSVNHGLPSAPVSVQVTMEGDNGQIKYLKPVVVLIDSTRFLIKFWYNDPAGGALQVNAGAYTSFHWRAEL